MMATTQLKIKFNSGSEGPRHDPYGWSEVIVVNKGKTFRFRTGGLGYYRLVIDDRMVGEVHEKAKGNRLQKRFLKLAGVTERQIDRAYEAFMNEDEDPMGPASRYE